MTLSELIELCNRDIAYNRDLAVKLATIMSCELGDDDLLRFWDFLVQKIVGDEKNKGKHGWFRGLIKNLSEETVEFLADTPNPTKQKKYADYNLGDLVQAGAAKAGPFLLEDEKKSKESIWIQCRGIWIQGLQQVNRGVFVDLNKENQLTFAGYSENDEGKKRSGRLWEGMSWYTSEFSFWQKEKFMDLFKEEFGEWIDHITDTEAVTVSGKTIPIEVYRNWEYEVIPHNLRREPNGIVVDKKFVEQSTQLWFSDCWFYQVIWTDYNDRPIAGWFPERENFLVKIASAI